MNKTERTIKARRKAIELIVKSGEPITVKVLVLMLGVGNNTIKNDIRALNTVHHQDEFLYYGDLL